MFNINQFNSQLISFSGVQKPTYYYVEIPMPMALLNLYGMNSDKYQNFNNSSKILSFYCKSSTLPGVMLTTSDVRRYGYGPVEKKPFVPLFNDVQMSFIGDGEGYIWNFFETWLKYIINKDSRAGMSTSTGIGANSTTANPTIQYPYEVNYKDDYAVDVKIHTLKPNGDEIICITLQKAYPLFLGDTPFAWDLVNDYTQFPITFTYYDWFNKNLIYNSQSTIAVYTGNGTIEIPTSLIANTTSSTATTLNY